MILLTGGSGLLGTHLQRLILCHAPSHAAFDITNPVFPPDIDFIVHCAAYTDVAGAERNRFEAEQVNVFGTHNLTRYPLVYISTEYVFSGNEGNYSEGDFALPMNWYGETKLRGELASRSAPRSLILRCLFKPRPFKHPRALVDQWTSGDYVDVMAVQIAQCIRWFEAGHFKQHDTLHLGTGRKCMFDLARLSRDVEPIRRADISSVVLPRDTSLNTTRYEEMDRDLSHGY